MTTYRDIAQKAIATEAEGLARLGADLDHGFDAAVDCILAVGGRVIVTGIGKSGHVARKIAATFASTGTPAQFVHPSEANHGDLGMITRSDCVLAISNSGEAPELAHLLAYAKRFEIPLIGITAHKQSALATHADIVLGLPQAAEAGTIGMVPTTSTTMTMALGDAIAVVLMEHRRFTAERFRDFHPGGKLGARLHQVSDLMHGGQALPLVPQTALMSDALIEISRKSFGVTGVTNDHGRLSGIITDGDLRRHMRSGLLELRASDVMTQKPATITPNALAEEAVKIMNKGKITSLFVLDADGRPHGLIHIHDCLRMGLA